MDSLSASFPPIPLIFGTIVLLGALGAFLYWLLVITEGVYLGSWAVILGYDIVARRYDNIKEFTLDDEQILVVEPLLGELGDTERPLVLDVATGTGRVPYFLFEDGRFSHLDGKVIGLEPSEKMLAIAQEKLSPYLADVSLIQQSAVPLPFPDHTFDAVTCLEALEFFPDLEEALREMSRVLKPGGVLITTRRIGWESRMFFGRVYTREKLELFLLSIGFTEAFSFHWETIYDLVIARKLP